MDKDALIKLAESGRFIPGIYNYCDRWCERCPTSSRCMVFAMERELFPDQEAVDIRNAAFWGKLIEMLQATTELLRKRAEEWGIDLDAVTSGDLAAEEARTEAARNHACCLMARRYGEMAGEWFERQMGEGEARSGAGDSVSLQEAIEVIRWYQHQIYIKLLRAIRSNSEEQTEIVDEVPADSVAQAKIVLIGLDRSIAAWGGGTQALARSGR